jgi:hypothetical protein
MRVQTLMELVGTNKTGFVIQHIKDGFRKIQRDNRENLEESSLSITSGVEDYNFPKNMEKILDVKIISDPTETGYVVDWNKYMWYDYGRTFKLQKIDTNGLYNTPDSSHTNGIKIVYTVMGYIFVYNPDGDSGYYTELASGGSQSLTKDTSIVFLDDGVYDRADYGTEGHYYMFIATSATVDTSATDFSDTDLWTDVTEQTSPDENSYINIDENYTDALVEFVKSKVTTDPKMEVFREKQFQKKTFEAQETRTTENKVSMPPRVYSLR